MFKRLFILPMLIVFLILLSGCINKAEPLSRYLTVEQVKYFEQKYSSVNNCTVMVCKYDSTIQRVWDAIKGIFTGMDYPNVTKCSFISFNLENQKDRERLDFLMGRTGQGGGKEFVRFAMIGIGNSLYSGEEMFARCNGNLGLNLIDISNIPKDIESIFKTKFLNAHYCLLNSGTIPFYKYGKGIDAEKLGKIFDGSGPLFISPGYEYSKSTYDPNIDPPTATFAKLKSTCKNCIVTATVKYGDIDTINYYRSSGSLNWDSIDVIAFTVNLSSFNSCDPLVVILNETNSIKWFAQNITEEYKKPSIVIVYGVEGSNKAGNCYWTNESIARFYEHLIKFIPELVSSGLIGVVAEDSTQLSEEAYRSFAFFCNLYYSYGEGGRSFASYIIYSQKGDKVSLCNQYNIPLRVFYEPANYSTLPLSNLRKDNTCIGKLNLNIYKAEGIFSANDCEKEKSLILGMATKYFVDPSLYMALLKKLDFYKNGKLNKYEKHCSDKCNIYGREEEKELCCLAETMVYYQTLALKRKSNLDENYLAYFIAYGVLNGESAFRSEIERYTAASFDQKEKQQKGEIVLFFASDSGSSDSIIYFQSSQSKICENYKLLCKDYGIVYYCFKYETECTTITPPPSQPPTQPPSQPPTNPPTQPPSQPPTNPPTQPPTQPPSTEPSPPITDCQRFNDLCNEGSTIHCTYYNMFCQQPISRPPPSPPPTPPSTTTFTMNQEIENVLKDAAAIRKVCKLS
ncbi:MAG: hypothetical protein NZ903_00420 [Candidatus Micrarchaeota archaeon]|nr:hypothetical protein [Candidatus Micrarchaeota archaeon]